MLRNMVFHELLCGFFLFLFTIAKSAATIAGETPMAKPECKDKCGNVSIPYPFGIGKDCSYSRFYEITCTEEIPRLNSIQFVGNIGVEVSKINISDHTILIEAPIFTSPNCDDGRYNNSVNNLELPSVDPELPSVAGPFGFSDERNSFVSVGCNSKAQLVGWTSYIDASQTTTSSSSVTCQTDCRRHENTGCHTPISFSNTRFNVTVDKYRAGRCAYAFILDREMLEKNSHDPYAILNKGPPFLSLTWALIESVDDRIDTNHPHSKATECESYIRRSLRPGISGVHLKCYCADGYNGNPYLFRWLYANLYLPPTYGCQDIDECAINSTQYCPGRWSRCKNKQGTYHCSDQILMAFVGISSCFGFVIVLTFAWFFYKYVKRRKDIRAKKFFFAKNGGMQLQKITSNYDDAKLFNSEELDKATDNFNENRILGQGGQGTVYKGMLENGKMVAVKKTKILNERNIDQFINEIVILSRINHRNIVKLLGYCLETEAPLLVYEFVPNGTLFQLIQDNTEEFSLTWDMRLQIASDTAGALAYLHSTASMPIYHRDIKSTNILLDEKYKAKVSDFGTSRLLAIDKTHVTTVVQGTFGYLDPEYFQSSQFTDRSDVYSFGVVLVELLTGLKPVFSVDVQESRSLVAYFFQKFEENHLFDILDVEVLTNGEKEVIIRVADIARRCLHVSGKMRPTMKEVATELEGIRMSQMRPIKYVKREDEYDRSNASEIEMSHATSSMTDSYLYCEVASSQDEEPLISHKTW